MSDGLAETRGGAIEPATLATFLAAAPERTGESLRDISPRVLRAIRTHLGLDVAFVSEFTGGQRVFRCVDAGSDDAPIKPGGADPLEDSYCQRVVDGRLPELIPDARAVPAAMELPVTDALPVGAHLSVPIRLQDGSVYGTLCCFGFAPDHSLNERDLAMMRIFADLIADQVDAERERDRRQREIIDRIGAVIAGDGLSMVYQPIVDLERAQPMGYEALARFSAQPTRGPDVWFAEAADAGLDVELELAAIRTALTALPQLPTDVYLAVNASPATLVSRGLNDVLDRTLADRIVVEITEHAAIAAYEQLAVALAPLRQRGVRVAVDDAGAGYASFRHILHLRPDLIKLDITITRDIDHDPARRALASALIAFARDTGSAIVAEGVETAAELRTLRRLGVTAAQGFHLGRPSTLPTHSVSGTLRDVSSGDRVPPETLAMPHRARSCR